MQANLSIGNRQMIVFSMCQKHIKYNLAGCQLPTASHLSANIPLNRTTTQTPTGVGRLGGGRLTEGYGNFQRCTVKYVNQRCRSNKTFAIISLYFEIYNIPPKNGWAMKIATLTKTATLFLYCVSVNPVIHLTHVGIHL